MHDVDKVRGQGRRRRSRRPAPAPRRPRRTREPSPDRPSAGRSEPQSGRALSRRASSSCAATISGGSPVTDTIPSPPASATAAAKRGLAQPPIGACWMGTVQPTRSVKRVLSIVALRSPDSWFVRHLVPIRALLSAVSATGSAEPAGRVSVRRGGGSTSLSADRESLVSEFGDDLDLASERPDIGANRGNLSAVYVASLDSRDTRLGHAEAISDICLIQTRCLPYISQSMCPNLGAQLPSMLSDTALIKSTCRVSLCPYVLPGLSHQTPLSSL